MLLASLDGLGKQLLAQYAQVAFRLILSRHSVRLHYQASVETVEEYAKVMLAEFEVLAVSSELKKAKARKLKEKDLEDSTVPSFLPRGQRDLDRQRVLLQKPLLRSGRRVPATSHVSAGCLPKGVSTVTGAASFMKRTRKPCVDVVLCAAQSLTGQTHAQ